MRALNENQFLKIVFIISLSILVLFFCSHALVGSFTRLVSDDYSIGRQVKDYGYLEGISYRYNQGKNGRYTYSAVSLAIGRLPQNFFPYLPAVVILGYLVASTLLTHQIFKKRIGQHSWWISFFIAGIMIGAYFSCAPNLFQVLYWKIGAINYAYPLIIFFLYVAYVLRKTENKESKNIVIIPALLIPFLNGAFNEAFLAVQTIILFLWVAYEWIKHHLSLTFKMLSAGVVGSVFSLLLIVLSPGTITRRSLFDSTKSMALLELFNNTLTASTTFILTSLKQNAYYAVLITVTGLALAFIFDTGAEDQKPDTRRHLLHMLAACLIGYGLVAATFATGFVGLGIEIPDRTKMVPLFVLLVVLFYEGFEMGLLLRSSFPQINNYAPLWITLVCTISMGLFGYSAYGNYLKIADLQNFAAAWDARDAQIRQSAQQDVRVNALDFNNSGGLNELRHFPDHWVNRNAALYYGKQSIIVCDRHYPDICLPAVNSDRGDIDCEDITDRGFIVNRPDPHGLDKDKNGIGCDEFE